MVRNYSPELAPLAVYTVAKGFHGFIYYDYRYPLSKLVQYVNVAAAHVKEGATPIIRPFREILPISTDFLSL